MATPRLPTPFALASTQGMNSRLIPPRAGMPGYVHSFVPYETPPDWPEGLPITVVDHRDPLAVVVRDCAGRERPFFHWQVDVGNELELRPGRWVHETDPLAIAARQTMLEELRRERWQETLERDREAAIERIRKRLERLGVLPLPPGQRAATPPT